MNKVLVVEDDKSLRENVVVILKKEGFEVIEASGGNQGYQRIMEDNPDLILCDIAMPDLNGYELFEKVHNDKVQIDTPFIYLTAKTSKTDYRIGMELGVDDYITKPFTKDELIRSVKKRLSLKEKRDDKFNRLKDSVKYSLPHELLTPLNAISMSAKMLYEEFDSMPREEGRDLVKIVVDSSDELKRVFGNYLYSIDLSILLEKKNKNESISIESTELVSDVITIVARGLSQQYRRESDITLQLETAKLAVSDEYLYKLSYELIDNAFKFSSKGDRVLVMGKYINGRYGLMVRNYNSSITSDQINEIDDFIQFGRANNEFRGVGLGLSISKKICLLSDATLSVENGENSFTVISKFNVSGL